MVLSSCGAACLDSGFPRLEDSGVSCLLEETVRPASLGILDLVTEDLGLGGAGEHPIASVKLRELS